MAYNPSLHVTWYHWWKYLISLTVFLIIKSVCFKAFWLHYIVPAHKSKQKGALDQNSDYEKKEYHLSSLDERFSPQSELLQVK